MGTKYLTHLPKKQCDVSYFCLALVEILQLWVNIVNFRYFNPRKDGRSWGLVLGKLAIKRILNIICSRFFHNFLFTNFLRLVVLFPIPSSRSPGSTALSISELRYSDRLQIPSFSWSLSQTCSCLTGSTGSSPPSVFGRKRPRFSSSDSTMPARPPSFTCSRMR